MSTLREDGVDGRTARRERNRLAALDAAFELFTEGNVLPSIDEIAARSGVSLRSMYRYFSDAHELHLLALARRAEVAEPMFRLESPGEGSLAERIDRLVDQRLRLYEHNAPAIRMALAIAPSLPAIRTQVEARKRQLDDQLRTHFAAELDPLPEDRRASVLACVQVLCQFESVEQLRVDGGMSVGRTRDALTVGLRALLSAPPSG
jgi:TetR/AcrR family transcriptional regulator, regulator of autoinduction and epiphytic fitness